MAAEFHDRNTIGHLHTDAQGIVVERGGQDGKDLIPRGKRLPEAGRRRRDRGNTGDDFDCVVR